MSNNHLLQTLFDQRSTTRFRSANQMAHRSLERKREHVIAFLQNWWISRWSLPNRYEKSPENGRSGLFEVSYIERVFYCVDVYPFTNVSNGISLVQLFGLLANRGYISGMFGEVLLVSPASFVLIGSFIILGYIAYFESLETLETILRNRLVRCNKFGTNL